MYTLAIRSGSEVGFSECAEGQRTRSVARAQTFPVSCFLGHLSLGPVAKELLL